MNTVHDTQKRARKVLEGLQAERERIGTRLGKIAAERESITPAALAGEKDAGARLEKLKAEKLVLAEHRDDVASAIRQAERDVSGAQAAVTASDRREVAQRWMGQADQLEAAGLAAHDAVQAFIRAIGKINETAAALRGSGALQVSDLHMQILLKNAVQSHLIVAGLADPTVAPQARRQLAELISEYAAGARANGNRQIAAADQVLGSNGRKAA